MQTTDFKTGIWGKSWDDVFSDDSKDIQGVANLTSEGVFLDIPFGSILGDEGVFVFGQEPEPTTADYLYGFTQKGDHLVIVDAVSSGLTMSMPGGRSQRILGQWLLCGKETFNPAVGIERISLRMRGLREWASTAPFSMGIDSSTGTFRSLEYDYENRDSYNHVLFKSEDIEVELYHVFTTSSLTVKGFGIEHDCEIAVTLASTLSLSDALDKVIALSRFLTLSQGYLAEAEEIRFGFEDNDSSIKCYGPLLSCVAPSEESMRRSPIHMESIADELQGVLGKCLDFDDELQEPIALLSSLLSNTWRMPIDLRFIAASQCLEALSKIGSNMDSIPLEEYSRFRGAIKQIEDAPLRKWLVDKTSSNEKGQSRLLGELLQKYPIMVEKFIGDAKAFVETQTACRNAYTHRNSKRNRKHVLKGEGLYLHTETVMLLCYVVLWSNLGVSEEKVISLIETSHYKNGVLHRLKGVYSRDEIAGKPTVDGSVR